MPLKLNTTAMVYTTAITSSTPITVNLVLGKPNTRLRARVISGVAREKVVAAPASRPNTLNMSMVRPSAPSARRPITGRQASLSRWRLRLSTKNM